MSDPVSDFNAKQSEFYETHDRTIPATPDEDTQPMSPPDAWPLSDEEIEALANDAWISYAYECIQNGKPQFVEPSYKGVFLAAYTTAWKQKSE